MKTKSIGVLPLLQPCCVCLAAAFTTNAGAQLAIPSDGSDGALNITGK